MAMTYAQLVDEKGQPYTAQFVSNVSSGSVDTTNLATSSKQDDQTAAINAVTSKLGTTLNVHSVDASMPLPAGAATAAKQDSIIQALNQEYALLAGSGSNVNITNSSIPVTVDSLPLPAGAATQHTLEDILITLNGTPRVEVGNTVTVYDPDRNVVVTNPVEISNTSFGVTDNGGSLTVDGTVAVSNTNFPVSGTVAVSGVGSPVPITDNNGSITVDGAVNANITNSSVRVNATALPLPTGAATEQTILTSSQTLSDIFFRNLPGDDSEVITAQSQGMTLQTWGRNTAVIQVTGTYTGALSLQYSVDGNNWVTVTAQNAFQNVATNAYSQTIPSGNQGIYRINATGFPYVKVIALAPFTGTANLVASTVDGNYTVSVDSLNSVAGVISTQETAATSLSGPMTVSVGSSGTSLVAASAGRKAAIVYNSYTQPLLISFATTASMTSYTTQIPAGGTLVIPRETWTGALSGIFASGTGNVLVTVTG